MPSYQFSGIAYPWGTTLSSYFDPKDDDNILRSSLINIIFTALGERVMLPEFGSRIYETPFEPGDAHLTRFIQSIIVDAVQRWDHRIEVLDVQLRLNEDGSLSVDNHQVEVQIIYRNKFSPLATQTVQFTFSGDRVIPGF